MRSFFSLCDEEQDWLNIHGTAGRLVIDRYRLWAGQAGAECREIMSHHAIIAACGALATRVARGAIRHIGRFSRPS